MCEIIPGAHRHNNKLLALHVTRAGVMQAIVSARWPRCRRLLTSRTLGTRRTPPRERSDRRRNAVTSDCAEDRAANTKALAQLIDAHGGAGAMRTGRAWRTAELRLKSFDDLQKLWFVLVKERNILLSERQWCKTNRRHWENGQSNLYKVKRSMARIQGVVAERARAYKMRKVLEDARFIGREGDHVFHTPSATPPGQTPGVYTRLQQ